MTSGEKHLYDIASGLVMISCVKLPQQITFSLFLLCILSFHSEYSINRFVFECLDYMIDNGLGYLRLNLTTNMGFSSTNGNCRQRISSLSGVLQFNKRLKENNTTVNVLNWISLAGIKQQIVLSSILTNFYILKQMFYLMRVFILYMHMLFYIYWMSYFYDSGIDVIFSI